MSKFSLCKLLKGSRKDSASSGGPSRGSLLQRLSDRRLVKQISCRLLEDPPEDCSVTFNESMSSLCFVLDDQEDEVTPFGDETSDKDKASKLVAPALLHRKELQLGKLLGKGGFSQVFALEGLELKKNDKANLSLQELKARRRLQREANNSEASSSLAVKHLNRNLLKDPENFQAAAIDLEHEAQFLGCLQHHNIVRVRGVAMGGMTACLESGRYNEYFLVMDRLSDTLDLRILRWNKKLSNVPGLAVKIHYGLQLASALNYLHQRRLVFRDIKPQNIGFVQDGQQERLQLFDFGLCRMLPENGAVINKEGETVYRMSQAGTRRYLSPEIYMDLPYNCKCDVYSWAIVFHEILSAQRPFEEFVDPCKLKQFVVHCQGRPPMTTEPFQTVPPSVKKLVQASWETTSAKRPAMKKVLDCLLPVLEQLPLDQWEDERVVTKTLRKGSSPCSKVA